jgi:lauroyl/myristoyl acyltransferase
MALYLIIQIGALLSRIMPRSWRYLIGTAVGDVVYRVWPAKRRILQNNMATVLGLPPQHPEVGRTSLKAMRNYCKYLIEFLELAGGSAPQAVVRCLQNAQGLEHLQRAVQLGKGVIIATAHFGTIEVGGPALATLTPFHAVHDRFRPDYLDRLIQGRRVQMGINPISVDNVRQMLRVLHQGEALALLFDRPVEPGKGVTVRFFGRETALPAGPAVLAMKTGAALLPIYQFRQPDRSIKIVIFPPISWTSTGERKCDVQLVMQKLVDTYQAMIRDRPDQWYMFRPMWPANAIPQRAPALERTSGGPAA